MSRIIIGDCRDVMAEMPDQSVDAVVTDPPYGVSYTYDGAFDDSPDHWLECIAPQIRPMLRISRGPVLWFGSAPTMARDLSTLQPDRVLIWAPSFNLSRSRKDEIFYRFHPIYCWRLDRRAELAADESGKGICTDVLTDPTLGRRQWFKHPASNPLRLMERLVRCAPRGGTVLDPFCGSGSTIRAAINTGRTGIGIELSADYAAIAQQRMESVMDEGGAIQQPMFAEADA